MGVYLNDSNGLNFTNDKSAARKPVQKGDAYSSFAWIYVADEASKWRYGLLSRAR